MTTVEIRCGGDILDWYCEASTTAEELISYLKNEAERLVGVANPALPYLLRLNNLAAGAEPQLTMEDAVVTGKFLDIPGVVDAGLTLHAPWDHSGQVADGSSPRKEVSEGEAPDGRSPELTTGSTPCKDGEQQEVEIPKTVILEQPAGATGLPIAHQPMETLELLAAGSQGPWTPAAPAEKDQAPAVEVQIRRGRTAYLVDLHQDTTDLDVMPLLRRELRVLPPTTSCLVFEDRMVRGRILENPERANGLQLLVGPEAEAVMHDFGRSTSGMTEDELIQIIERLGKKHGKD